MKMIIKATSENVTIGDSIYRNDLINLNNTTAIIKEDLSLQTDREHFVINFWFNNEDNFYWRFSTKTERDVNYDAIVWNYAFQIE